MIDSTTGPGVAPAPGSRPDDGPAAGPAGPAGPAGIPRRDFIRLAGLVSAGVAGLALADRQVLFRVLASEDLSGAAGAPHAGVPSVATGDVAEHQWAYVIDLRRCDGCGKCTTACQEMHHLPPSQEWIKVYTMTDASGGTFKMPVLCQMCESAPCVQVCPVNATYHVADGAVLVDQDTCIGCRMCMAACPYGVRTFNWETPPAVPTADQGATPLFRAPQVRGTVGKCDNCAHALREGGLPACVEFCPMYAIYVGDFVEDVATNGRETVVLSQFLRDNDAFRFKEELGTETRVYYIAGHAQDLGF